jgi:outer membrane lipoprotein-sorting protein
MIDPWSDMTRRLLVVTSLMLFVAGQAIAAEKADPPKPEDRALSKQLEEIDARGGKIKDFTSDFRQEKFTALLKKPLVSSGVVRVAGPVIRWDTKEPEAQVLYSDGKEVRMYYPSQKLLEIYAIDQRLGDLASSPLPRLQPLREHFTLEKSDGKRFHAPADREVLPLRLVPREEALRQHVDEVDVLLDVTAAHILELEIVDADGDRTHVTFSGFKLDTGVTPADLKLTVPADTTVSRPLEGKREPAGK